MADWVVLFGGRDAAVDAAITLNLNVLLVAEPKTPKRIMAKASLSVSIALRTPFEQLLQPILEQLNGLCPLAIIAVSEQGVLPAAQLRDYFQISGQDIGSARDCLVKSAMKQRFLRAGLPCWPTLEIDTLERAMTVTEAFSYPLVVKALASSGSRGFRIIRDRAQLRRVVKRMLLRMDYGGIGLEPFCHLKECSVELFVQSGQILFSNITDYLAPGKANILPASFNAGLTEKLLDLSTSVLTAFEFSNGMLHIEYYYDPGGNVWIGEINARPPGGGLMDLIKLAYQIDPWKLVIQCHLPANIAALNPSSNKFAANWVIHPGKGLVTAINGNDLVANHPLTERFFLKLKVGQQVYRRRGTGEFVGNLTMLSAQSKELIEAMNYAMQTLKVELQKTPLFKTRRD